MKYLIRGEDGREYGPIDEETLRKWTETGRVVPHTPVRNVLIKKWNKASDLDFLIPAFAVQGVREEREKNFFRKFSERLNGIFGGGKGKKEELTPWASSFKNKYLHDPASVSLRIAAFAFDLIIIGGFSIFLMLHFSASFTHPAKPVQKESASSGISPASTAQTPEAATAISQATASPTPESASEVNSAFNKSFYMLLTCVLLYYGLSLGIFAQTFGMWFWGLMLAKTDLGEVLFGRAYFFTVLMLLVGALSPLIVYFNPYKRSLHEILSGTMVIKTAARPKAG
ncbi:MAG: RDD family protein [Victivallales bacterium]